MKPKERHPRNSVTAQDIQLFDAIVKHGTIKEAALSIGRSPSSAYSRVKQIKRNVRQNRLFNNQILAQSKRSQELKRAIWAKVDLKPVPESEDDDEVKGEGED